MKKIIENFIDLAAFRKANNMSQEDLAELLGTSRGFISMIESGRSKLPEDKLQSIYDSAAKNTFYFLEPLCPAYARLGELDLYLKATKQSYSLLDNLVIDGYRMEDALIPKNIQEDIRYGRIGINPPIADKICNKFPSINKEWLLYGEGTIDQPSGMSDMDLIKNYFIQLIDKASKLESKIDKLTELIETNMCKK